MCVIRFRIGITTGMAVDSQATCMFACQLMLMRTMRIWVPHGYSSARPILLGSPVLL